MQRAAVLIALLGTALACGDAVSPTSVVDGVWVYTGTQDAPSSSDLDGTVTWHGVAGGEQAFEGTFSMVERQQNGALRNLSGPGAGQILSDSIADFDLTVSGVSRRHIGILRGDSITGSWSAVDIGQAATGRFVLRRNQ